MVETIEKVIVLGHGFLGKTFEHYGYKVWDKKQFCMPMHDLSMLDRFDVVINCMAKSNTRWCEQKENFAEASLVNGLVPQMLSDYCKQHGKRFVHISTG